MLDSELNRALPRVKRFGGQNSNFIQTYKRVIEYTQELSEEEIQHPRCLFRVKTPLTQNDAIFTGFIEDDNKGVSPVRVESISRFQSPMNVNKVITGVAGIEEDQRNRLGGFINLFESPLVGALNLMMLCEQGIIDAIALENSFYIAGDYIAASPLTLIPLIPEHLRQGNVDKKTYPSDPCATIVKDMSNFSDQRELENTLDRYRRHSAADIIDPYSFEENHLYYGYLKEPDKPYSIVFNINSLTNKKQKKSVTEQFKSWCGFLAASPYPGIQVIFVGQSENSIVPASIALQEIWSDIANTLDVTMSRLEAKFDGHKGIVNRGKMTNYRDLVFDSIVVRPKRALNGESDSTLIIEP